MFLPPASRTTMSGRSVPSPPRTVTCSSKSQRALIPASSTTRRSCISPQRPRASGRRRAVTRAWVWAGAARSSAARSAPARPAPRATGAGPRRARAAGTPPGPGSRAAAGPGAPPRPGGCRARRGPGVGRAQPALGDLQEGPRAAIQRLGRHGLEPLGQLRRRPAPPAPGPRAPQRRPVRGGALAPAAARASPPGRRS